MKYPLDQTTLNEFMAHVTSHMAMQTVVIQKMGELLNEAMNAQTWEDEDWYKDSKELLQDLHNMKMYHESRRFDDENFRKQRGAEVHKPSRVQPVRMEHDGDPIIAGLQSIQFDSAMDAKFSAKEATAFGAEMSETDLEKHFGRQRPKKIKEKPLKEMSLQEIEAWERKQDNSNDIYKVSARVKNLAREGGAALTPQGDMLANTYTHVLLSLYGFAEKIQDATIKINLINLIRSHENMPANLIAAAGVGVTRKKK